MKLTIARKQLIEPVRYGFSPYIPLEEEKCFKVAFFGDFLRTPTPTAWAAQTVYNMEKAARYWVKKGTP